MFITIVSTFCEKLLTVLKNQLLLWLTEGTTDVCALALFCRLMFLVHFSFIDLLHLYKFGQTKTNFLPNNAS